MTITNKHGLPASFVEAVRRDPYQGGGDISATALIDSPQRRALLYQHGSKIDTDVSSMVWALLGSAVHHILERSEVDGVVVEERLYADVGGWEVSGQFDRYNPDTKALQDYKVTTVYKLGGDKKDWTRQLNVLRCIALPGRVIHNPAPTKKGGTQVTSGQSRSLLANVHCASSTTVKTQKITRPTALL